MDKSVVQRYLSLDNKKKQSVVSKASLTVLQDLNKKYTDVNIGLLLMESLVNNWDKIQIESQLIEKGLSDDNAKKVANELWDKIILSSHYGSAPVINQSVGKSRLFNSNIENLLRRLRNQKHDVIVAGLYQSLLQRQIDGSLATLRYLAETGNLQSLLSANSIVQMLVSKYRRENSNDKAHSLLVGDDIGTHLNTLLYFILVERLQMTKKDAAFAASDLVGIAREKGERIDHVSYFDETDNQYHWL